MMIRMAQQRPARRVHSGGAPAVTKIWQNVIWQAAATWAVLFCATLIAYGPALRGGLVWDDAGHVTASGLQSLHGLWRIWFELGATQQYYPLLHSAFWIEHRLWGDAVLGYHVTNIALHAISACLVVSIVRRLTLPGAGLAGLVFALHPVCVEAVAWISEQKSTLSGAFYLAAALCYLHFDKTRAPSRYFLALGLFVLALLSKTVTATLPAALLVLIWWMRGRLQWRRDILPLLPWFGLAIPAGLITAWVERVYIGAQGSDYSLTLAQRLLMAGRAPWFYAFKALWPANLMFSYPKWKIDSGEWWQYLFPLGLLALALAFGLLAWRAPTPMNRGPLAAFLIFVGTLFPVLGFLNVFPFRYSYVADHFEYLAILAIVIPVSCGLTEAAGRMAPAGIPATALPALLLAALGLLTWQQSGIYRDDETLYRATLARNPDSYFAHLDLGNLLFAKPGRLPEAIAEFEATLRLKPDSPEAHMNLGNALAEMPGRAPEAIDEFRTALRFKPDYADAHDNLGLALAALPGRRQDAIDEFRTALRIEPSFAEAHLNLGIAYSQTPGRLPEAIAEYQAALRTRPDLLEAHSNLGNALSHMPGRQADAIAEYRAALRIDPNSATVHFNLGNVFQTMGRLEDALAEYQASLRIDPDAAEVHYELAYALARMPGRLAEAIAECREMLRIRPNDEPGRQLMASLLAFQDGRGR
jgi:protein O-mannosyl-transferase